VFTHSASEWCNLRTVVERNPVALLRSFALKNGVAMEENPCQSTILHVSKTELQCARSKPDGLETPAFEGAGDLLNAN
jgi:hypothetical protein